MSKVSLAKAKDRLSELIRQAEAGAEVLITRRGKVVARLVSEAEYPELEPEDIRAGLAYAAEVIPDEQVFPLHAS